MIHILKTIDPYCLQKVLKKLGKESLDLTPLVSRIVHLGQV